MKTESITRLISALGRPSVSTQSASTASPQASANRSSADSDAVRIAKGFGQSGAQPESSAKSEKIEQLKTQVQSGSYNFSTEGVAVALIKDLGI